MKYANKEEIKEQAIIYYLEGKTLIEISELLRCSRNYLGTLIKDDERIIKYRNQTTNKVRKMKNRAQIDISIPTNYWEKIGILKNSKIDDYVDIKVDEIEKKITIQKHK